VAWTFGWGALLFSVNLWWLQRATVPGYVGLVLILSVFPALAAGVWRGCGLPRVPDRASGALRRRRDTPADSLRLAAAVVAMAVVWVALEWVRGNLFTGFPWLFVGHAQSPFIPMIQVADFAGVYGVSFWVVCVNALIAVAVVHRARPRLLAAPGVVTFVLLAGVFGYGVNRMDEDVLYPGPRVLLVQPNHAHERGGRKLVSQEVQVDFHLGRTRDALAAGGPGSVDLVLWSETVMPGLNGESLAELSRMSPDNYPSQVHRQIGALARQFRVNLITGAYYVGGWADDPSGKGRIATDIRNSAYLYDPKGELAAERYDKIHLLPFAEIIPLRRTVPFLYTVLEPIVPSSIGYEINPGHAEALPVIACSPADDPKTVWRCVTPICSEDTDAPLVARMFRPTDGSGRKRADLIAGIINDGWFLGNTREQHLQCALFRAVENRAPIARVDNTGISTFVDSLGRVDGEHFLGPQAEGTTVRQVMLDRRTTFYSVYGDVFGIACAVVTGGLVAWGLSMAVVRRGPTVRPT
jgi:apolipoprotein N-acyltransferase